MAFEDVIRTYTLNVASFWLAVNQRLKNARTKLQSPAGYTANDFANDAASLVILGLDAWADLLPGAGAAVSLPIVFFSTTAASVPPTGAGPGGAAALPAAPGGVLAVTNLMEIGGAGSIAGTRLQATVSVTTLTVTFFNAGPMPPIPKGLFQAVVTAGGSPIALLLVQLT